MFFSLFCFCFQPLTINASSPKKEQEVFDSLKAGAPPRVQNDYSSNVEKGLELNAPVLTKSGAQLQKLDFVNEEMPLAKDMDLTRDDGSVSPTDSGLNCDYTPDVPDELSPIPVAFHHRTGSSHSDGFGVFSPGETEALISTDGQATSENPTDPEESNSSSSSTSIDKNSSDQAQTYSDSNIRPGNNSLGYSQISERSVDGYVAQPVVPTGSSANSPFLPAEASDGTVPSDGSISSYVQHVGMTTELPDVGEISNHTSTSGRSECPSYVKQSAPPLQMLFKQYWWIHFILWRMKWIVIYLCVSNA